MHTCVNCNNQFPNFIYIDGKKCNLQRRKYCLDCTPFGTHNTRKLETPDAYSKIHVCKICQKEYKGGHLVKANICSGCFVTRCRRKTKQKIIEYLGGQCVICGYNRCVRSLQCHHVDKQTKSFGPSGHTISWKVMVKELDKCVLLCANCHGEYHSGMIDPQRLLEARAKM